MEDQDRTPEEEADVEGHLADPDFSDPEFTKKDDDDDVEAHALRDPDFADPDFARGEEKDPDFS